MYDQATLDANGGHTPECEGSCSPECPIGQERRAIATARALEAQRAWRQAYEDGHLPTDEQAQQHERDQAQLARIGGREYTRRLADLTTRRQPISYRELDSYVAADARSLLEGRSYQRGAYSQPWAWIDTDGDEHLDPATYHGLTHIMSARPQLTTVPEAAFDWPIYVAGIGLRLALGNV